MVCYMHMAWQVGFSESNIRALCDVGRTTKKHTVGYIGQKGIGFKSVFKITDAPQIHSGGFHVAFDLMQHSALGYVLPTWVPDAKDISAVSKLGRHQTATKVVLPFKQVCPEVHRSPQNLLQNRCCRCQLHGSVHASFCYRADFREIALSATLYTLNVCLCTKIRASRLCRLHA